MLKRYSFLAVYITLKRVSKSNCEELNSLPFAFQKHHGGREADARLI